MLLDAPDPKQFLYNFGGSHTRLIAFTVVARLPGSRKRLTGCEYI